MNRFINIRFATVVLAAGALAAAPVVVAAQDLIPANLTVTVDGHVAGVATAAANLPTGGAVLHQSTDATLPSTQVVAASQGNVILLTSDPALVAAMQAWMQADNAGYKDTVQRKTVQIDRTLAGGPNSRYALKGAWPTKIQPSATPGGTLITIVFQSLEPVQ